MDVMFYETFAEERAGIERHLDPTLEASFTSQTIQEYGASSPPARLISVRGQSDLSDAWANEMTGLLSRITGYDHLLAFRNRAAPALPMGYLPLYCHRAVAEQALMLMLGALRKLGKQMAQFASFNREGLTGIEAEGKTALVIGVGHVGSELCKLLKALGMTVIGIDLVTDKPDIDYVSSDEGLPRADVIIATMSLTPLNRGYFDDALFAQTKAGVVFVNVSRGELSPPSVLLRQLQAGQVGAVALDVHDRENLLAPALRAGVLSNDPEVMATLALARLENVILTPHNAFNTREGVQRKAEHSARQANHFLKEGRFLWPVPDE